MPAGRRSLTKTSCRAALPVLLTNRVKVTLVPGEPTVGLAVLVTDILGFLGLDIGRGIGCDVLAVCGFTCDVHMVGQSLVAGNGAVDMGYDLKRFVLAPDDMGPMSDQETFWPACVPAR